MSKSSPGPIYSIDSSSFMDWQARYYPLDVFSGVVDRVEGLISAGRFLAPELVRGEGKTTEKHALYRQTETYALVVHAGESPLREPTIDGLDLGDEPQRDMGSGALGVVPHL